MTTWIADTGPLVALLARDDKRHEWTVEQTRHSPATMLTCDAVLSEALFLLKHSKLPTDGLFELVETGFLRSDFEFQSEFLRVRALMRRYRDRPMSFADACLVRMAELHPKPCVWTLDRDFQCYRMNSRQTIPLVAPW